jgi:signal transduction histidine kinase
VAPLLLFALRWDDMTSLSNHTQPARPTGASAARLEAVATMTPGNGTAAAARADESPDHAVGWATPDERRHMFLLVRYVLIVAVSSLTILNARAALTFTQAALILAVLASNVLLSRVKQAQFFRWWVQGPVLIADTLWIAVLLVSAGFGQQFFLFYFIQLFLAGISESLGLLAVGATLIGLASIALSGLGDLSAATLIRVPFFFAIAVFYGYVVDMAKHQRRLNLQRDTWARQLENEVRIRTRELEQQGAALRRMYEEVRAADRMKSDFVANVSHELRTPIHVILGYADLALDDPELPQTGEVRRFLERIAERGRILHRLVENVLAYANLERGQVSVSPRRFPIDRLIDDLRVLCNDLAPRPGLTVRLQNVPGVEVTTDYDRLHSTLSNLLLNAVKFTPSGVVELSAREAGEEVEITVRDTGIGISRQELVHIFEPFRQVDGSSTRRFTGVGLGLAIVSRNVKLLRGRIETESEIGKGSTFRLYIPRCIGDGKWCGGIQIDPVGDKVASGDSQSPSPPD